MQICVKGPSGATLKIWNVDSIVASNRRLIGIRRDAMRFVAFPVPRRQWRSLSSKINQLKFSEHCHEFRTSVTILGNFSQRHCHLSYQNQEAEEKLWLPSGNA